MVYSTPGQVKEELHIDTDQYIRLNFNSRKDYICIQLVDILVPRYLKWHICVS